MKMLRLCVIISLTAAVFSNRSADAGVVGSWTFDGPDAGMADISGHNNGAEAVGGFSYSDDAILGDKALLLSGDGSYVKLFTSDAFNGDFSLGQATLSMWVKLNAQAGLNCGFAAIGIWSYPSFYPASSAGVMSLKLFLSEGEPVLVNLPQSYDTHQWNHIAVTVDTADEAGGYKVYLNGQLAGTFAMDGTYGNFLPPLNPRIGITYDISTNTAYYMNGIIDEVKIYNEALTASQVNAAIRFADLDADGRVDYRDMMSIAENWGEVCALPDWCAGGDFDRNGFVDISDLAVFAAHWLD